mmetsp:Transcript_1329/g.2329  ORF Transcript_1329/g.2329 Transcript_1329/m.2329 type:complete len:580 (-) Transcript_1329:373-2112(-)
METPVEAAARDQADWDVFLDSESAAFEVVLDDPDGDAPEDVNDVNKDNSDKDNSYENGLKNEVANRNRHTNMSGDTHSGPRNKDQYGTEEEEEEENDKDIGDSASNANSCDHDSENGNENPGENDGNDDDDADSDNNHYNNNNNNNSINNHDDDDDDENNSISTDGQSWGQASLKAARRKPSDGGVSAEQAARLKVTEVNEDPTNKRALKRKSDRDGLKTRNEELEASRPMYLKRIADLQQEVDSMRMAGSIDLRKENKLLRVEILKHKTYISNLLHRMQSFSAESQKRERVKLVQNMISAAVAQVVGLTYASTQWDPVWMNEYEHGMEISSAVELLPRLAPLAQKKRFNLRYQILNAPLSATGLHEILTLCWTNPDKLANLYGSFVGSAGDIGYQLEPVDSPEIKEAMAMLENEQVALFKAAEKTKADTSAEFTLTSCSATHDLVGQVLLNTKSDTRDGDAIDVVQFVDTGMVPCSVYANVSCSEDLTGNKTNAESDSATLGGKMLYGHVVLPGRTGTQTSHAIVTCSVPFGQLNVVNTSLDMFNEDGELTELFAQGFDRAFDIFAEEIIGYAEATEC